MVEGLSHQVQRRRKKIEKHTQLFFFCCILSSFFFLFICTSFTFYKMETILTMTFTPPCRFFLFRCAHWTLISIYWSISNISTKRYEYFHSFLYCHIYQMVLNMKMFCGSTKKSKKKFDWRIKRKNPETIIKGEWMYIYIYMVEFEMI